MSIHGLWCRKGLALALALCAAVTAVGLAAPVWGAEPATVDGQRLIERIEVHEVTVRQALRMIAKAAGDLDFIITDDVTGTIPELDLRDITAEAAIELICQSQRLYWQRKDGRYTIAGHPLGEDTPLATAKPTTVVSVAGTAAATGPSPVDVSQSGLAAGQVLPATPTVDRASPLVYKEITCQYVDAGTVALRFGGSVFQSRQSLPAQARDVRHSDGGGRDLWSIGQADTSEWAQMGGSGGSRGGSGGGS
jgi:hypothetical protein